MVDPGLGTAEAPAKQGGEVSGSILTAVGLSLLSGVFVLCFFERPWAGLLPKALLISSSVVFLPARFSHNWAIFVNRFLFQIAGVLLLGAAMVFAMYVAAPWALPVSLVTATVGLLLFLSAGRSTADAEGRKAMADRFFEVALDITMSVVGAVVFRWVHYRLADGAVPVGVGNGADPAEILAASEIVVVGIVLFATQTYVRSHNTAHEAATLSLRAVKRVDGIPRRISDIVDELGGQVDLLEKIEKVYGQAGFAKALAEQVYGDKRLAELFLQTDSAYSELALPHRQVVALQRSWVSRTKGLSGGVRQAWLKVMSLYFREERYDISRREVVTNVRNFAQILTAILTSFVETLSSSTDKADSTKQVVIINGTAFSPKDLFNYPGGSYPDRFHYEAEFYGTFRRLLARGSRLLDPENRRVVVAGRVFFVDGEENADLEAPVTRRNKILGWPMPNKDVFDAHLWNFRILPKPLRVFAFPEGGKINDQWNAERLSTISWTGFSDEMKRAYSQLPRDYNPVDEQDNSSGQGTNKALWLLPYRDDDKDPDLENWDEFFEYTMNNPAAAKELDRARKTLVKLVADADKRARELNGHGEQVDSEMILSQFAAWTQNPQGDQSVQVQHNLDSFVRKMQDPLREELWLAVSAWVAGLGRWQRGSESHRDLEVLKIAFLTQWLDAAVMELLFQDGSQQSYSNVLESLAVGATGAHLGPGEQWLYWWLVNIEWEEWKGWVADNGYPEVGRLLLGSQLGRLTAAQGPLKDVKEQVEVHSTTWELTTVRNDRFETLREMGLDGGEFFLIGLTKGHSRYDNVKDALDVPAGVDWKMMVQAKMGEPFLSTSVEFDTDLDRRSDALNNWLKEAFGV